MKTLFLAKVNKYVLGEKHADGGVFSTTEQHLQAHIRRDEAQNTDPDLYYLYEPIQEVGCDEETYKRIVKDLIPGVNITWFPYKLFIGLKLIPIRS